MRVLRADSAASCRLPGSDLLLGLPVVLDTNNDNIREGQRVRPHTCRRLRNSPAAVLSGNQLTQSPCSLQGGLLCFKLYWAAALAA